MQLTNILRDLQEDFGRNRIYLPAEDLRRFGLNDSNFFSDNNRNQLGELIIWEVERAESYYEKASNDFPCELRGRLIAASIMGRIYQTILQRVKTAKDHHNRIELSRREKLAIGYRVITESNS
jgi:phytoene synthase